MTPQERKVMGQALEALYALAAMHHITRQMKDKAITAIEEALAQPEQDEPVAWMNNKDFESIRVRIMQEAYELADRNDSEGYNAIKVMCGDVQRMLPPQRKEPEQEPVAVVNGVYGGRFIVEPTNSAMVLPVNMALYTTPPQPKEPEQEPVAWMTIDSNGEEEDIWYDNPEGKLLEGWSCKPLYTRPRTWVGLTYEDMVALQKDLFDAKGESVLPTTFAMAVEAKLKEKNT